MLRPSIVDRIIAKIGNWSEFVDVANRQTNAMKGDLFERLSQLYLETRSEYRTKLKNIWVCKWDLPAKVRKQLGLPTSDEGIDLVAGTVDGQFWAIQSKYRTDQSKPLTLRDLTTFTNLAFNARNGVFDRALIIHTSSRPVRKQKLLGSKTVEIEDWTREIIANDERPLPEWLCVCSDESAGAIDQDEFVGSVYDLGLDVTTDPERIKSFLTRPTKARQIVFVTYQSSPLLSKVAKRAGIRFDVAILDEAHRTAGARSKSFATLLFDKNLPISKRIFMTATERVARGSHNEIVSMDREADYGKVFYHLSFKDAIHSSPAIISDYKVLTVLVSDDEIRRIIQDRRFITDERFGIEEKDARELAVGIALQKAFSDYKIKHVISFHRSINAALEFRAQQSSLVDAKILSPRFDSLHISSKNSAGERAALLQEFAAAERALRTNARCLTEGVDIPAIDCVLFADPKQSTIDIVQASGRALRPYPGKKFGYIMVPLVIPDGVSFETFSESTNFRQVSRVIASLSTQDERIAEEFRVVDRAKKTRDRIINIVSTPEVGINVDLQKLIESISTKIWERIGPLNWRPFEDARTYARGLKLNSLEEWKSHCNNGSLPSDIPRVASSLYRETGWVSWGDFLGTGNESKRDVQFRSFENARTFARRLSLKNAVEWAEYCKSDQKPFDIPSAPSSTYRNRGWINWGDWLGTGTIAPHLRTYRSFKMARDFARALNLKNQDAWRAFCKSEKLPSDVPANPNQVYKNSGWVGMGDWLGTGKLPDDIPHNPSQTYRDNGWAGIGDWLGTK